MSDREDYGSDSESDDEEDEDPRSLGNKHKRSGASSKKKKKSKYFDDSAVLSDEEGGGNDDDDDDEEDDSENDSYEQDGFVVDNVEEEEEDGDPGRGDLDDSDSDDDDSEDEERRRRRKKGKDQDSKNEKSKQKKKKKIRKMGQRMELDEDDMDLINENQGRGRPSGDYEEEPDDDYDNFIDDGYDQGGRGRGSSSKRRGGRRGDNEGDEAEGSEGYDDEVYDHHTQDQMQTAVDIFGTEFLKTSGAEGAGRGGDADGDDALSSSSSVGDDDDIFGEDPKVRKARRKVERKRRNEARVARLRRSFEPALLMENFCTETDDQIRTADIPERYFHRKFTYLGGEEEATWILHRVPEIEEEYRTARPPEKNSRNDNEDDDDEDDEPPVDPKQAVVDSLVAALKHMYEDKLEPEFIRRYRADIVTSAAVRDHLFDVVDQDAEYHRLLVARNVASDAIKRLSSISGTSKNGQSSSREISEERVALNEAQKKLDDALHNEEEAKKELAEIEEEQAAAKAKRKKARAKDKDKDDDDLFGDDDDEDDDEMEEEMDEEHRTEMLRHKKQKARVEAHLSTLQALVKERAERVAELSNALPPEPEDDNLDGTNGAGKNSVDSALQRQRQMSQLFHEGEYRMYLKESTESRRHVRDLRTYLGLLQEGNDALRGRTDGRRRQRFDRYYYRTCVAQGLRAVCYKLFLSPLRAGIILEAGGPVNFDYVDGNGRMSDVDGDDSEMLGGDEGQRRSSPWMPPILEDDPPTVANELMASGEKLVPQENGASTSTSTPDDPLKACRYVAAMELAYEPRIVRRCRAIYRQRVVVTTYPTTKGLHAIHAHHEYFGLHLIRNKPVYPRSNANTRPYDFNPDIDFAGDEDRFQTHERIDRASSLQHLRILAAVRGGDIRLRVHLPYVDENDFNNNDAEWYLVKEQDLKRKTQDISAFLEVLEPVYLGASTGGDDQWAEERRRVLRMAVVDRLLPLFEHEARYDLAEAATVWGIREVSSALQRMAMEGPYRPNHLMGENRFLLPTGDLPVVGVSVGVGGEASYLAGVDPNGTVRDHLALPSGTNWNEIRPRIVQFLVQMRPAAVVVGTGGHRASSSMAQRLGGCLTDAMELWNNRRRGPNEDDDDYHTRVISRLPLDLDLELDPDYEEDDEPWRCNVELIDDDVCQLYARGRVRGPKEFPDYCSQLLCAVSIARRAQDPLSELCYAWSVASDAGTFGSELLHLRIHPCQRLVPPTRLLRHMERVLLTAVAEVGVDINAACSQTHLHGLLSFVPGLGPRKALSLRQSVARTGASVVERKQLLEARHVGPTVYNNAVAFLRIRATDDSQNGLNPLDDTRLHPDVYIRNQWATKIAMDALDIRWSGENNHNPYENIRALRDVMDDSQKEVRRLSEAVAAEYESAHRGAAFLHYSWDPRKISENSWQDKVGMLDLEMFAKMIEKKYRLGKWYSHLVMIVWEFRLPFHDPRRPMEPLNGRTKFRLLTGEDDWTIAPGREVTGRVMRNTDFVSIVRLDCDGVDGILPLRNCGEDFNENNNNHHDGYNHHHDYDQMTRLPPPGSVITAVVTEVKIDRLSVELSTRERDLEMPPSQWPRPDGLPELDRYFDGAAAHRIEAKSRRRTMMLAKRVNQNNLRQNHNSGNTSGNNNNHNKAIGAVVGMRACGHPAFRNKRQDQVERELEEAGEAMVGRALIRPSSSKPNSLILHWVVRKGSVKIIEVLEEGKDTDASIGNILRVAGRPDEETYESIDELLGRYTEPMNDFVDSVINHRKFVKDVTEEELDKRLVSKKKAEPKGFYYNLCWSGKYPGSFSLRFVRGERPRRHRFDVSPDGYIWRTSEGPRMFSKVESLLNAFKRDPHGTGNSGNVNVNVPTTTTTTHNSHSSSNGGTLAQAPPRPPPPKPSAGGWGSSSSVPPPPPPKPTGGWGKPLPPGPPPPGPVPPLLPPAPGFGSGSGAGAPPPPPFGAPPFQPPPPPGVPPPGAGYPPDHSARGRV